MRVFVTGATGFVGGRVAERLLARGDEVVALVRDPWKAASVEEAGALPVVGDITEPDTVRSGMESCDAVVHLAARYELGSRDPEGLEHANVYGARVVLEAMRDLEVPRGVHVSTLAVHGDTRGQLVDESYRAEGPWLTDYDRTKWRAHYEVASPLAAAGLPVVIAQPGVVVGPGDPSLVGELFRRYLSQRLPFVPPASYCWADVEDVAGGILLCLDEGRAGEAYHLAGEALSVKEVLELGRSITGIPPPQRVAPPGLVRALAGIMSVVERVVRVPAAYSSEALRAAAGVTYLGDSAKAREELGWRTRPLEETLHATFFAMLEDLDLRPG